MASKRNLGGRLVGWAVVVACIAVPLAILSTREPVVDVTVATIKTGRVEQTITAIASGTVLARENAMVAAELLGKVVAVAVEEGDRVAADDLLLELSHAELDAQVALAEANLKVGQSRQEQAKLAATIYEEVAAAQVGQPSAQLEQTRNDFQRIEALSRQSAVSRMDLDRAALALKVAREANAGAEASQRESLVRQEEVRSTGSGIEQLQAALEAARATREKAFVRAPFAGVVAKTYVDVGEAVVIGAPVVHLVQDESLYIEAPFDEANTADIQVGQTVRINIDAYRDQDFSGEVDYVSPVISLNRDLSRTLNVKVRLTDSQEFYVPGMSADVIIVAALKDGVLFVPSEAVVRQRFAYVIEGDRVVRRTLQLGVGNWDTTEVIAGLSVGDQVVTSVSLTDLRDGVRVRVVDDLEGP